MECNKYNVSKNVNKSVYEPILHLHIYSVPNELLHFFLEFYIELISNWISINWISINKV